MTRIDLLEAMLTEAQSLIDGVSANQLGAPTPCTGFDVRGLLNHMCTWISVFDLSVNERPVDFDPETYALESGWAEVFAEAAEGVVSGLRTKGFDRPMTMTADPIPGSMVLDMLSMEYIGHGLDLAKATQQGHGFTEEQASVALAASERLIQPEYRGTEPGQFHPVTDVCPGADAIDRFFGFIGRDSAWISI